MELQKIYLQVHDFLNWVAECDKTAKSDELGTDYEHIQTLQYEFHKFALRTVSFGSEQVWSICDQCDQLMALDHPEVCTISLWRDEVSEVWENLLELIDTRMQALEANYAWHIFMHDCRSTLSATVAKIQQWSSTILAEDMKKSNKNYLTPLKAKERMRAGLAILKPMIQNVENQYKAMDRCYSGEQLAEIESRASDVASCWRQLKNLYEQSGNAESELQTNELLTFLQKYTGLRSSIDDVQEKLKAWPEDIGVNKEELDNFMKGHQALKKLIASREKQLEECTNFGSGLISQRHFAATDVEDKLLALNKDWVQLMHLWEQRFEKVQKVLLKSARSLDDFQKQTPSTADIQVDNDPSLVVSTMSLNVRPKPRHTLNLSGSNPNFYGGMYTSLPNVTFQNDVKSNETGSHESYMQFNGGNGIPSDETLSYEGILFRKRLRRRHDRIAVEGGWKRFYCVLRDGRLLLYTDKAQKEKDNISKKYPPMFLPGTTLKTDVQHGRLQHLFVLQSPSGVEYLFQARDDYHLNRWVRLIRRVIEKPYGTATVHGVSSHGAPYDFSTSTVSGSSKAMLLLKKASPGVFHRFFERKKQKRSVYRLS